MTCNIIIIIIIESVELNNIWKTKPKIEIKSNDKNKNEEKNKNKKKIYFIVQCLGSFGQTMGKHGLS